MKRKKQTIEGLLAAVVVLGLTAWAFRPPPVAVDVATVTRGSLQVTVDEDGRTRIKEQYIVSSPLAGRLQRITLKAGDPVVAGETLVAVIEPSVPQLLDARAIAEAEARVKAAEATWQQAVPNLERARANFQLASIELKRVNELYQANVASRQELDVAEQKEHTTAEDLKAAQFAGQIAEYELEQTRAALLQVTPGTNAAAAQSRFELRAPVDGRVLRVFQESATVVSPGVQLVELGDPSDLELVVDVLSADGVRIRPGDKMIIERWGGDHPLLARVRLVEPAAFQKISALGVEEQRVNVIGDFVSPPGERAALGDAYRVEARMVIWEGDGVLQVPAGSLFRHEGEWAVFLVDGRKVRRQVIKAGRSNGLSTEVLDGLREGDTVVLYPGDRLQDGRRIRLR